MHMRKHIHIHTRPHTHTQTQMANGPSATWPTHSHYYWRIFPASILQYTDIYIYIYIYVYIYIHIHVHIHVHMHRQTYTRTHTHKHTHIHKHRWAEGYVAYSLTLLLAHISRASDVFLPYVRFATALATSRISLCVSNVPGATSQLHLDGEVYVCMYVCIFTLCVECSGGD
jgi:hypothetical protein